jgi:hypothetical protein
MFLIFYFWSWIFDKSSKFWAAPCKKASNPPACSVHGLHVLKPWSFSPNVPQKCGRDITWPLGCGLRVKNFIIPQSNQKRAGLWWIFSSSNSAPANRKTGFYANREPNKQEVGFIFAWSGSELWSLVKYSRSKIKNLKHIAVDVLLKCFPMIPLSCRSNRPNGTFKILRYFYW